MLTNCENKKQLFSHSKYNLYKIITSITKTNEYCPRIIIYT